MTLAIILTVIVVVVLIPKWARGLGNEVFPEDSSYEYKNASAAYKQAEQNFEQADPEFIDVAICDLCSAELRVGSELWKIRNKNIRSDTWKWITLACDGDLQHHTAAINRMTATLEIAVAGYDRW